ncbi:MAG: PAS domain-containing protein [Anaerolineales bacterium]|nr:PAS domain-containing protein [Anaerolineales bacterium]
MNPKSSRLAWLNHIPAIAVALLAAAMLVFTPIWAFQWQRIPFLGMLLEPNQAVSQITGDGWPARNTGAEWSDRLISIDGTRVGPGLSSDEVMAVNGFQPVDLVFERENQERYAITVTPITMPVSDLVTLFGIPYLVGLIFLVIGVWAYRLRGNMRASRGLLMFTAAVSMTASAFYDMNTTHHAVLVWALSLPVAGSALFYLAMVFPQQLKVVDRWPWIRFLPWLVGLGLSLPTGREILAPSASLAYITTWQANYAYMALAIGFFLFTLTWQILRSESAIIRQQSRVIVFGATLAFLPIMVFFLLPTAFSSTPAEFRTAIYFPLLILLPLSITYAILRYRLLDVDRFLGKVLTYTMTTGAALLAFYGLVTALSLALQRSIPTDDPLLIALYLLLLVLGLMPLRELVQRLIDRLFYRSPADYRRVLNNLSNSLVVTPDVSRTVELLGEQIGLALSPEEFLIYLYDDERALYLPHARTKENKPAFQADHPLIRRLRDSERAVWFPPNSDLPPELVAAPEWKPLGCLAFVPLRYEDSLIGFIALGLRRSGEPYSGDDLEFLATVGGQSTLALENARLFSNLRRTLDQTLEMKNLLDDIFASIATGVITTDIQRKVTLFNQAAEHILGVPVQQVLGKSLLEALPGLCPDLELAAQDALERGVVTLSREMTPTILPRGELFLRLSCSPLRDAYLGTKGTTIVFEDLTDRRMLEAEQERIRQTFGKVVAPRVRDRLLADPGNLRLNGTRQKTTILFADLSGFTHFTEISEPEILFTVLNDYLSLAAQAILEEEGTLDKFMGDAVMALWNVPDSQPDHAMRAARAALSILERAAQAHARMGDPAHHLLFRIGVATGDAIVGNVGTRELFNYTAVGDAVNLAQRLEVTAQPGQILVDQTTYAIVGNKVVAEPLEPVLVKGRTQPVAVYVLKSLK